MDDGPAFRAPQQLRSQVTLDKLLDATERLAATTDYAGLTLNDIAAEAGLTIGAIYRRFSDKRALFLAVQDRCLTRLTDQAATVVEAAGGAHRDLETTVTVAVALVVGGARHHEGLLRAFVVGGASDDDVRARGAAFSHRLAALNRQLLRPHHDEITHPDPAVAIDIAFRIVQATLEQRLHAGATFTTPMRHSWRRLQDELTAACIAYLTAPRPV